MSDIDYEPVPWPLEKSCSPRAWCAAMKMALDGSGENSRARGLSVMYGIFGENTSWRVGGVMYNPGRGRDSIVLNLCPWCGRSIRF